MISFDYLKLTFDISMAFIRYDCRLWIYTRAISTMLFCVYVFQPTPETHALSPTVCTFQYQYKSKLANKT